MAFAVPSPRHYCPWIACVAVFATVHELGEKQTCQSACVVNGQLSAGYSLGTALFEVDYL
jgi:hypothetical protein